MVTDFASLATDLQRIQVFDDGVLVAETVVSAGFAGTADRWPDRLDKLGGSTECYAMEFDEDATFLLAGPLPLAGEPVISGDEIRLLAEDGQAVIDKTSVYLEAAGLEELTLEDVVTTPPPFFADGFESGDTSAWSSSVP